MISDDEDPYTEELNLSLTSKPFKLPKFTSLLKLEISFTFIKEDFALIVSFSKLKELAILS